MIRLFLLLFYFLADPTMAGVSLGLKPEQAKNPNEPYGCNLETLEKKYRLEKNINELSKVERIDIHSWSKKNPLKAPLIVLFNPKGQRIGCIENPNKKANEHQLIIISEPLVGEGARFVVKKKEEDRIIEESRVKTYTQIELINIYNSANHLKTMEMNDQADIYNTDTLHFPEDNIDRILDESGAGSVCLTKDPKKAFNFFRENSGTPEGAEKAGSVDFFSSAIQPEWGREYEPYFDGNKLFSVGRKVYNPRDFGNYLWGAAMHRACFPCVAAKIAAHVNNIKKMCTDNPDVKKQRELEGKKCRFSLDSPTDQAAIWNGCKSIYNKEKRELNTCREDFEFKTQTNKTSGHIGYYISSQGSKIFEYKNMAGKNMKYVISFDNGNRKIASIENGVAINSKIFDTKLEKYSISDEHLLHDEFLKHDLSTSSVSEVDGVKLTEAEHILNVLKTSCGPVLGHTVVSYNSKKTDRFSNPEKLCIKRGGIWKEASGDISIEEDYGNEFEHDSKDRELNRGIKKLIHVIKRNHASVFTSTTNFFCEYNKSNDVTQSPGDSGRGQIEKVLKTPGTTETNKNTRKK